MLLALCRRGGGTARALLPHAAPRPHAAALAQLSRSAALAASTHAAVEVPAADVHPPFARYAHASTVPENARLIFTSGQLGITPEGDIPPTAEEQALLALQNVLHVLRASGAGVEHVVRLNSYVTAREHLAGYMRARDAIFANVPPTASTLMIVSGFARPEFLVEVEAIAALPPTADGDEALSAVSSVSSAETARTAAASAAASSSVAAAAHGRRRMHTGARRRQLHGERAPASSVREAVRELRAAGLKAMHSEDGDDARREIARRSRDFYWYSPILKETLKGRVADALVLATSETDVIAATAAATRHGVPLTVRGAGTGNYGQVGGASREAKAAGRLRAAPRASLC